MTLTHGEHAEGQPQLSGLPPSHSGVPVAMGHHRCPFWSLTYWLAPSDLAPPPAEEARRPFRADTQVGATAREEGPTETTVLPPSLDRVTQRPTGRGHYKPPAWGGHTG